MIEPAKIATISDPSGVAQAHASMAILRTVLAERQRERAACFWCRLHLTGWFCQHDRPEALRH